jgi:nicotinamidase-related amidase
MAWVRRRNISVISTCDISFNNNNNNGSETTGCCFEGTEGQKKIRYTLLNNRADFAADGNTDLPVDILRQYRQIILNKRCVDPFDEPRIERLLSEVRANEFVLIGASAEGAVKATALGLLQRGKRVSIVIDAVGSYDKKEADLAFRKMKAKGARLVEAKKFAGTSHLKHIGICGCGSCQGQTAVKVTAEY